MFNTNAWLSSGLTSNKFYSSYIQGFLDICGNIVLRNGGFSLTNGDVSMNGNLWVGKNAKIIGNVSMNGNLWVGLDASLNRDVSIRGNTIITNSIYQIDGKQNMNIATDLATSFPNYGTTATGPNLTSIGEFNFSLTTGGLRDSIALGYAHYQASNPTGHSNIALGGYNFSALQNGTQNIGIGHNVGLNGIYSLNTGDNNVFIGRSVCSSPVISNTVAVGFLACNWTGSNSTAFGGFTNTNACAEFQNVTLIGGGDSINTGATATFNNQLHLGTAINSVDISGVLNVIGAPNYVYKGGAILEYGTPTTFYPKSRIVGFNFRRTGSTAAINGNTRINVGTAAFNDTIFNTGEMAANGIFTAPVSGFYIFHWHINITFAGGVPGVTTGTFAIRKNATAFNNGTLLAEGRWQSGASINFNGSVSATTVVKLNSSETVSAYTGSLNNIYTLVANTSATTGLSNCYGFLLFAS